MIESGKPTWPMWLPGDLVIRKDYVGPRPIIVATLGVVIGRSYLSYNSFEILWENGAVSSRFGDTLFRVDVL